MSKVRGWDDKWLYQDKSIYDFGIIVPEDLKHMMVKDLIDVNGCWSFYLLLPWLLDAVMPPTNDCNDDKVAWSGTSDVTRRGKQIGFGYGRCEFQNESELLFG
ncbi:hypothetical protein TSUD_59240 [Trifolium subterraneum]|uniref:Uncharacterized protein n=1 Tax=Trifolium subterraneum TaxID=3900 RepID=A0A2Z6MVI2_TRISU|nr:hypothetical protein TSUD_59240 [Trifolium subterraneum]